MDAASRAALEVCPLRVICGRFKPHLLMVLVHTGYTILYFIAEAAFNNGLNPHVMVTYRHVIGGLVIFPFAYVIERYLSLALYISVYFSVILPWTTHPVTNQVSRKNLEYMLILLGTLRKARPKLTLGLFAEIFVLSLFGIGLTLNMYFASLKYTSPTFLASMVNSIASLTFVLAIILRLENLDVRNPRGLAKILGTFFSFVGVMIMTSCKGPIIRNLNSPIVHIGRSNLHENWTKGSILTVASCITWSIWYIMQAFTVKRYPAPLSITTWMNFLGGAQSAVIAVILQRKPEAWSLKVNIQLWSTIYAGVVCSGITIFVLIWCTKEKGLVFVTMFNPLSTIMVAFTAYFVLGEKLYMGSILGAVIAVIGLYLLLWGKEFDQQVGLTPQEQSNSASEEQKEPTQIVNSP